MKIYFADFRSNDRGGGVVPGRVVQFGDIAKTFKRKKSIAVRQATANELAVEAQVVFLVHGFNVNRADGRQALFRLAKDLPSAWSGAIVAVLWPGDGRVLSTLSYSLQINDANDSAVQLARFVQDSIRSYATVSFVSHSLGARVVLGAVERLMGTLIRVDQVCLMAPAVNDTALADTDEFRSAAESSQRVGVLASRQDNVLKWAYQLGQHPVHTVLAPGTVYFLTRAALGYDGPRPHRSWLFGKSNVPVNVYHEQIPDDRNSRHRDYIPATSANRNQKSAALFADQIIGGLAAPQYQ